MKRIVLIQFHRDLPVCKNRSQLLRLFNPDAGIYGIFGGDEGNYPAAREYLADYMDNVYCIKGKSPHWKWKNGDLALRQWFLDYGKDVEFDVLHLIEWDMIMLDTLDRQYADVPVDAVGLSGLIRDEGGKKGWRWTSSEEGKKEMEGLLSIVKETFGYDDEPYRCITGGACYPRKFIEQYSNADVPELCNDEVRMPLYAQIFGIRVAETGFYDRADDDKLRFFNLHDSIDTATINGELNRPSGWRVFHPYYRVFNRFVDPETMYNVQHDIRKALKDFFKNTFGRKIHEIVKDIFNIDFKGR